MSGDIAIYDDPRHMEPLMPESRKAELAELTTRIFYEAGQLKGQVHAEPVRQEIARLVRQMNCYYSNLIEGHKTLPRDIEKAARKDFSTDEKKRDNQELSVAHIQTEEAMDALMVADPDLDVYSPDFIAWIHKDFYERLPEHLQVTKSQSGTAFPVVPGQWRDYFVDVNQHTPPHHDRLPAFLSRFHAVYGAKTILATDRLTAIAAAHHRMAWIHPFGDGNGRVVRLHSHALLKRSGLDSGGLWTLSRGLARYRSEYYSKLQGADQQRAHDVDGRGQLSDRGLANFCIFFLESMLDQITFMGDLLELPTLRERVKRIFQLDLLQLGKESEDLGKIVEVMLDQGQIQRREVQHITGKGATVAAKLIKRGLHEELFKSPSKKGVLQVHFATKLLDDLFPKLFLDLPVDEK